MERKRDYISIIIPVYNADDYLDRCLSSLVNQTYKKLEIILVDDGSSDKSPALCEYWSQLDNRILSFHQPNGGAASARNTGLDSASGEYIMFVDADDYVDSRLCEVLITEIQSKENTDCVICGVSNVNDCGKVGQDQAVEEAVVFSGIDVIRDRYVLGHNQLNIITPWGKLFRSDIWNNLRFTNGLYYEDMDIMPYLFNRCAVVKCIPYIGYYYYQREGSCSHGIGTDDKRVTDSLLIRKKHIAFFESIGEGEIANSIRAKLLDLIITSDCNGWIPKDHKELADQLFRENFRMVTAQCSRRDRLRYMIYRYAGSRIYKLLSQSVGK